MPMPDKSLEYQLGEMSSDIKSIKSTVDESKKTLDHFDERLRKVEQKSAVYGALSGGIIAVGISIITAKIKSIGL